MNDLGKDLLNVLESSVLGKMSVHVLRKQSQEAGIDLNNITAKDIPRLVDRLKSVLPFFIGDDTNTVLVKIKKLSNNGGIITGGVV